MNMDMKVLGEIGIQYTQLGFIHVYQWGYPHDFGNLQMLGYDWTCNLQIFRVPPKQYLQVLHLKISVYMLHPEVDIRKAQLIPGGWW